MMAEVLVWAALFACAFCAGKGVGHLQDAHRLRKLDDLLKLQVAALEKHGAALERHGRYRDRIRALLARLVDEGGWWRSGIEAHDDSTDFEELRQEALALLGRAPEETTR